MTANRKRKRKTWLILIIILVVLAAGSFVVLRLAGLGQAGSLENVKTAAADTGTIVQTVSGTGNLTAEETREAITVLVGLAIDQVLVEAGDEIQAGEILATFDEQSLQAAIRETQAGLDSLDARLYQLRSDKEPAYIRSAAAGRVKQVFAREGIAVTQTMSEQGALLVLSLDGKMSVSFQLPANHGLAAGDAVEVALSGGSVLEGTVKSISDGLCTVTVSDKSAETGDTAEIRKEDGTVLGQGILEISRPLAITGTSGTVASVLRDLNDYVYPGTRLLELDQADHSQAYEEIYAQRQDEAEQLRVLLGYAANNSLTATCSGLVRAVGIAEGQLTGSSSPAAAAAPGTAADDAIDAFTVRTASRILFAVAVDELDIAVIRTSQPVSVTLDALTGKTLEGTISEISDEGTLNQGGTTFQVKVDLPDDRLLKAGMTATAVITVAKKEAVLRIPLEALQETDGEQFVFTGTAVSSTELGDKRIVTTGISDGVYVEILSGLKPGEKVNYYYATGLDRMFPFGRRPSGEQTQGTAPTAGSMD